MAGSRKNWMSFRWKIFAAVLFGMLLAQAVMIWLDLGTGMSIGANAAAAVAVTLVLSRAEKKRAD